MKKPYITAFPIPFFLFDDCFVKNETVRGMSGKTQGVNNAMNPPTNPSKKIFSMPFPSALSSPQVLIGFFRSKLAILIRAVLVTPPSRGTVKE